MITQHHEAHAEIFITPGGILGEHYCCSCGATSTAAQMAHTPGGAMTNSLFGNHPCIGILRLHQSGENFIVVDA